MRYVPVSDELKSIAERLGVYLHRVGVEKVQQKGFWTQFSSMVDRGITLLSDAVSGDLLAPPMWQNKGKGVIFSFDQGKMPGFFAEGAHLKFDVTLRVHSKTHEMFILKNA
jgi:hypothetical protein